MGFQASMGGHLVMVGSSILGLLVPRNIIPKWCNHKKLICYYFAYLPIQEWFYGVHVWSPIEVKVAWFKGLGISLLGLKHSFIWVFYYGQFCIKGQIYNLCNSCKQRIFWYFSWI